MIPTRIGVACNGMRFAGFIRQHNKIDSVWISPGRFDDYHCLIPRFHLATKLQSQSTTAYSINNGVENTRALAAVSKVAFALTQIYDKPGSPNYHIPSLLEMSLCMRSFHPRKQLTLLYNNSEGVVDAMTHSALIPRGTDSKRHLRTICLPFQRNSADQLHHRDYYLTSSLTGVAQCYMVSFIDQYCAQGISSYSRLRFVHRRTEILL